ncbi:hypothetical protein M408DRAFT_332735 [Serendipita vermifera MAFF 305830]|uniref:Uncharacterized protein n=1 Tax=Serendipita vermifera MAFF 305830 TaxID=933852 RepID=A0A0C3AU27_SERVB|nr:hypothetical protein M408DRAFT_332735 [Serendipita vermifera MAFF 305830]
MIDFALFCFILLLNTLLFNTTAVIARPLHHLQRRGVAPLLYYREYTDFQISDGFGGNALEEAKSIIEEPFRDVPLVHVHYSAYERLSSMWEAVEYASILSYPNAVKMAERMDDDALVDALHVGETKNDVLMRLAQVQIMRIKIAKDGNQGRDTEESEDILSELEDKLMAAAEDDRRNRGRVSHRVELAYPL